MIKVLLLVQAEQRINLDAYYSAMSEKCDCDVRWLSDSEQSNLEKYFIHSVEAKKYDRIIFFLRFKKEIKQRKFIATVPNLVILEHDACQNYMFGKYHGEFSRHYRAMPWVRILSSGYEVTKRLQDEGFDARFVPKGYDQNALKNLSLSRDIDFAFIGSLAGRAYVNRRNFLEKISVDRNVQLIKTSSLSEYLNTLNRIRIFVSADIGLGEYMIKNFEAMACGCLVLACDQGERENAAHGFEDMKNIVLYNDYYDALEKLDYLIARPELVDSIAKAGQKLVESTRSFSHVGKVAVDALMEPLRQPVIKKKYFGMVTERLWRGREISE